MLGSHLAGAASNLPGLIGQDAVEAAACSEVGEVVCCGARLHGVMVASTRTNAAQGLQRDSVSASAKVGADSLPVARPSPDSQVVIGYASRLGFS